MASNLYLLALVTLFSITIIYGFPRYRRQLNPANKNNALPTAERSAWVSHPSGSYTGAYYFGIGSDPNYGSHIKPPNRPHGGVLGISYDPDNSLSSYLINSNQPQAPQQAQQHYFNNNNNAWQRPYLNNYNNPFYNRYPVGSQGWYATGGNHWYNKGQSLMLQPYLLMLSTLVLIVYK